MRSALSLILLAAACGSGKKTTPTQPSVPAVTDTAGAPAVPADPPVVDQGPQKPIKNSTLDYETMAGKRVLALDGVPIRRTDALTKTEAAIT